MGRLGRKRSSPPARNMRDSLHNRFQIPEEVLLPFRDPPFPRTRGPIRKFSSSFLEGFEPTRMDRERPRFG